MAERSDLLRLAVANGDVSKVKGLLSQGLNSDLDKDGRSLLHVAAQNGRLETVRLLVGHGFNPRSQDSHGYTPLHRAAAQGHVEVIELLLESGCLVDLQDECGNTALHVASWNGFSRTVTLLLKSKANINAANKAGFTALHSAGQKGHNETARVLLYSGCQLNAKNKYGDTPLHTSAQYGHAGVVRILISARCRVNIQNKNGETALHKATTNRRYKVAKLLIVGGAKKKLKNKQSETALDISRKLNDTEMILTISSEEKLTKSSFLSRRHKSDDIRRSFNGDDDVSSADDVGKRRKSSGQSHQGLSTVNSGSAFSRTDDVLRGRSLTAVELERSHSDRRGHLVASPLQGELRHQQMENGRDVSPGKVSPNRPPPSFLPKPGHVFYQDLSGQLKQGPVGCVPFDRSVPSMKRREIAEVPKDLYEPSTRARGRLCSESRREPVLRRLSGRSVTPSAHSSAQKSKETHIQGRRSNDAYSWTRSVDFSRCLDSNRRLEGGRDLRCICPPVARGKEGNRPDVLSRFCVEEEKNGAVGVGDQTRFESLSDETYSVHSEDRRQGHQSNYDHHHHMMTIPNADDNDWMMMMMTTDAAAHRNSMRFSRSKRCQMLGLCRINNMDSLDRKSRARRTLCEDDLSPQPDLRICKAMSSAFIGSDRFLSHDRRFQSSKSLKEKRNCSARRSAAETGKNSDRFPEFERVISGARKHSVTRSGSTYRCRRLLACERSEELAASDASSVQSVVCDCTNRTDEKDLCMRCLHENSCSLRKTDAASNPDSGYASKIYPRGSDRITDPQRPVEERLRRGDKNSVRSRSKELADSSSCNCAQTQKTSAANLEKDETVQTSRRSHVDRTTTLADVHHQPSDSFLAADDTNAAKIAIELVDSGVVSQKPPVDGANGLELDVLASLNLLDIGSDDRVSYVTAPSGDISFRHFGWSTSV